MSAKIRIKKIPCCSSDCCCGTSTTEGSTVQHDIPIVSTELDFKDILGGWKVRLGLGRMNYMVEPGLYAAGSPNSSSPVFVSAYMDGGIRMAERMAIAGQSAAWHRVFAGIALALGLYCAGFHRLVNLHIFLRRHQGNENFTAIHYFFVCYRSCAVVNKELYRIRGTL